MSHPPTVEGFLFTGGGRRHATVCEIANRAEPSESQGFEPSFVVRFKDGFEDVVVASDLEPWYAT